MTTETERALNWLGCQNFRPMDKKYLDTIRRALQQNEKLVSCLKIILKTHDLTCKPEECQISGIDLARQLVAEYEKGE